MYSTSSTIAQVVQSLRQASIKIQQLVRCEVLGVGALMQVLLLVEKPQPENTRHKGKGHSKQSIIKLHHFFYDVI
jgi:hypothetical protein